MTTVGTWEKKITCLKTLHGNESTRVPLLVRAPKVTRAGQIAQQPVSLIDIYPTLVDLCQLKGDTRKNEKGLPLDGHSFQPFLKDPQRGTWAGTDSALSIIFPEKNGRPQWHVHNQNYSLRTIDFRYIKYNNGKEELYDHRKDQGEHTNLAEHPEYKPQLDMMRKKLKLKLPANSDHLVGKQLGLYK